MSSDQAKTYHSVNFGEKNTWDDWQLIPESRPVISPPSIIEESVQTQMHDGDIPITDYLLGNTPHCGMSEGEISFIMVNLDTDRYDRIGWAGRRSEILEYLHNRRMQLILDDDPEYYYEGRFQVKFTTGEDYSTMNVTYKIDIYHQPIS